MPKKLINSQQSYSSYTGSSMDETHESEMILSPKIKHRSNFELNESGNYKVIFDNIQFNLDGLTANTTIECRRKYAINLLDIFESNKQLIPLISVNNNSTKILKKIGNAMKIKDSYMNIYLLLSAMTLCFHESGSIYENVKLPVEFVIELFSICCNTNTNNDAINLISDKTTEVSSFNRKRKKVREQHPVNYSDQTKLIDKTEFWDFFISKHPMLWYSLSKIMEFSKYENQFIDISKSLALLVIDQLFTGKLNVELKAKEKKVDIVEKFDNLCIQLADLQEVMQKNINETSCETYATCFGDLLIRHLMATISTLNESFKNNDYISYNNKFRLIQLLNIVEASCFKNPTNQLCFTSSNLIDDTLEQDQQLLLLLVKLFQELSKELLHHSSFALCSSHSMENTNVIEKESNSNEFINNWKSDFELLKEMYPTLQHDSIYIKDFSSVINRHDKSFCVRKGLDSMDDSTKLSVFTISNYDILQSVLSTLVNLTNNSQQGCKILSMHTSFGKMEYFLKVLQRCHSYRHNLRSTNCLEVNKSLSPEESPMDRLIFDTELYILTILSNIAETYPQVVENGFNNIVQFEQSFLMSPSSVLMGKQSHEQVTLLDLLIEIILSETSSFLKDLELSEIAIDETSREVSNLVSKDEKLPISEIIISANASLLLVAIVSNYYVNHPSTTSVEDFINRLVHQLPKGSWWLTLRVLKSFIVLQDKTGVLLQDNISPILEAIAFIEALSTTKSSTTINVSLDTIESSTSQSRDLLFVSPTNSNNIPDWLLDDGDKLQEPKINGKKIKIKTSVWGSYKSNNSKLGYLDAIESNSNEIYNINLVDLSNEFSDI